MKILVCGGRNFGSVPHNTPSYAYAKALETAKKQREFIFETLDSLHRRRPIEVIVHGDSRGADRVAEEWAEARCIHSMAYPARWNDEGPSAGPRRNQRMLVMEEPDKVLAFPGGQGTADMVNRAKGQSYQVIEANFEVDN